MDEINRKMEQTETVKQLANMGHRVGCVTKFTLLFHGFITINRDYGIEETVTIVELSMLVNIIEQEGVTASELSKKWKKTKGAISQTLKKLETKKLIYKERDIKDGKIFALYPTNKGKQVVEKYYMEDTAESPVILQEMLKEFTVDEIATFYRVMDKYSDILMNIL